MQIPGVGVTVVGSGVGVTVVGDGVPVPQLADFIAKYETLMLSRQISNSLILKQTAVTAH